MRTLRRNKQKIYYANFVSEADTKTDGVYSGDATITYGTPTEYYISVSESRGQKLFEENGTLEPYTRMMVADKGCPIKIDSILWVDVATTSNHDYVVTQVSETLNGVSYVIAKVDKS